MPEASFDSVGLGLNAVDHLAVLDAWPTPGSRAPLQGYARVGGGQVATALCAQARLGLRVKYLGKVGDDETGRFSLDSLLQGGVDVSGVVTVAGEASQMAVILVVQGERTICWRRGPGLTFVEGDFTVESRLAGRYLQVDTHEIAYNIETARLARERGVPVLIDAEALRPRVDELLRYCDLVLADENFARQFTRRDDPHGMLEALQQHSGARLIAITRGDQGSILWSEGQVVQAPACSVTVVDTTGAGDVWHGAFGYAWLHGWAPDRMLRFANAAAARSCEGLGGRGALPRLEAVETLAGESFTDLPPDCVRSRLPSSERLDDAFAFAREVHHGQTRDEGTPYFAHPCRVAAILHAELGVRNESILAAGLLHDTLEDAVIERGYFEARFGPHLATMVGALTKDGTLSKALRDERYFAGLAAASDDTILVKIADRIDNLRQLHLSNRPGKRQAYLEETRQHHLPLAARVPQAQALLLETLERA